MNNFEKFNKIRQMFSNMNDKEKIDYLQFINDNLQNRIDKAIDKLEFYNGWESNLYDPVQEVIEILKGDDEN